MGFSTAIAYLHFIREIQNNLLYRKLRCQFLYGALLLALMFFDREGFLCGLRLLEVLFRLCFVEQSKLVRHDIVPFLAGLPESCPLGVEQQFIHVL